MNIKEKLTAILEEYRGKDSTLNENATFDEMGFDSLDKVELLMKVEEEFNIVFEDDLQINSLSELVAKIETLVK
jgi:acyl carrier protein